MVTEQTPADEAAAPPAPQPENAEAMEDKLQEEITALIDAEPQAADSPPVETAVQSAADVDYDKFVGIRL